MTALPESAWEQDALETLAEPLGWRPAKGDEVAPGSGERDTWDDLLIRPRLLGALRRLNPGVHAEYLQQAVSEIAAPKSQDAIAENYRIHQAAPNAHLAIEALRKSLTDAGAKATRGNLVRQRAFSERIAEIMNRYTNQQITPAEVIAELVELAKDVEAEASRGATFSPPLSSDELAFYDAVATNESAVDVQGEDVLAQIARELVAVMRRDVRTDWTVRDDVRAKLRSSIKRLLVKYKYPPDKQPEAIKLVMDQMESMAPRFAQER